MTKTSEIISDAFRESNLIADGAQPTPSQQGAALRRLNVLVSGVYGFEVGDPLIDWPVGQHGISTDDKTWWGETEWCYPPINTRLIAASDTPQNIHLHPNPSDGARVGLIDPAGLLSAAPVTIHGNGRRIEGQSSIELDEDNVQRLWFYRAETGNWTRLSELTAEDDEEFPFPIEFDDYFVTMLAARINPRYGRSLSEESSVVLATTLEKMRARYYQRMVVLGDPALARLSRGYNSTWRMDGAAPAAHIRRSMTPPFYQG